MHPLVPELTALKEAELENKINELTRKYFQTVNPGVQAQIVAILDCYREELSSRRAKEYEKMIASRDKNLDKLINVN